MTVKELVEKLLTMDQSAVVVYRAYSEWNALEPEDIEEYGEFIERHGTFMKYNKKYWDEREGGPTFFKVVALPGN